MFSVGFGFIYCILVIGLSSTLVGLWYVVSAFVALEEGQVGKSTPAPFYTLLVAVICDFLMSVSPFFLSGLVHGKQGLFILVVLLGANILLLIVTAVLAWRTTGPGIKALRRGSVILLVIVALNVWLLIAG